MSQTNYARHTKGYTEAKEEGLEIVGDHADCVGKVSVSRINVAFRDKGVKRGYTLFVWEAKPTDKSVYVNIYDSNVIPHYNDKGVIRLDSRFYITYEALNTIAMYSGGKICSTQDCDWLKPYTTRIDIDVVD